MTYQLGDFGRGYKLHAIENGVTLCGRRGAYLSSLEHGGLERGLDRSLATCAACRKRLPPMLWVSVLARHSAGLKAAREAAGKTVADVAAAMRALGHEWHAQQVLALEGSRLFRDPAVTLGERESVETVYGIEWDSLNLEPATDCALFALP